MTRSNINHRTNTSNKFPVWGISTASSGKYYFKDEMSNQSKKMVVNLQEFDVSTSLE